MDACLRVLNECIDVQEAHMPDSRRILCNGQYIPLHLLTSTVCSALIHCFRYAVIDQLGDVHLREDNLAEALKWRKKALELYHQSQDSSYDADVASSLISLLTQHDIMR